MASIKISRCNMEKRKSSLIFDFPMLHNEAIDNAGLRKTEKLEFVIFDWVLSHLTCSLQQF